MRCHWIFAIALGALWGLFHLALIDDSPNEDSRVVIRYVERELILLESGEEKGSIGKYWTGNLDRSKELLQLRTLLLATPESEGIDLLLRKVETLLTIENGEESEVVVDLATDQEEQTLFRRSLIVGSVSIVAVLLFPVFLWKHRVGLWRGGPRWRVMGVRSVPMVLGIFFLSELLSFACSYSVIGVFLLPLLPESWMEIVWSLSWRGLAPLLAAFFMIGSWRALVRIFGLRENVHWWSVAGAFSFMIVFEWLRQIVGTASPVVDPSDFYLEVNPVGWDIAITILDGVIFAPVFEELMFRGVLFLGLMTRLGGLNSAIVSSILFAVIHTQYDPWEMFSIGVFGLACCWLTWRTGSLKSGIALHVIYNGLITLDVFLFYQMPL